MVVRLVFIVYLLLLIVIIHLWHYFARWLVETHGILPAAILIFVILAASQLPPRYWGEDD
jgi:uncharacterized membrane protein